MTTSKKRVAQKEIPSNFTEATKEAVQRIDKHHNVLGLLYLRNASEIQFILSSSGAGESKYAFGDNNVSVTFLILLDRLEMYTVPGNMVHLLSTRLPLLHNAIRHAVTEITSKINSVNPIVDRIMDDESVEGVIMTNKEGAPILTNITVTGATNYGFKLQQFGLMTQMYIKQVDPFDEVFVVRLHTKKLEIMFAPNPEFGIVVLQHARHKIKAKQQGNIKNNF